MVDETGMWLLPSLVRGWSLRGTSQRLLLRSIKRQRCNVIAGVTPAGVLYYQRKLGCMNSQDCAIFLRHLLGQISGRVLVLWDGWSSHRSGLVKEVIAQSHGRLLVLPQNSVQ